MTEIFAVQPPRGQVVHLHAPTYQPSERARPHTDISGMCGAPIWPNGNPTLARQLTPLAEALKWTALQPSDTDPRPVWKWCRACLGHAAVLVGLAAALVDDILDKITPCSCGGRRWVEDENWSPEHPDLWRGERDPGKGLIPCGRCNHGGWGVDEYEVDKP